MWHLKKSKDKEEKSEQKNIKSKAIIKVRKPDSIVNISDEKKEAIPIEINASGPEILHDTPEIRVKGINLEAHVSVEARLGKMVKVNVGIESQIGSGDILIQNVKAEAHLSVRLERVINILNAAIQCLDTNLSILKPILLPFTESTGNSLESVGDELRQVLTGLNSSARKELTTILKRNDIEKPVSKNTDSDKTEELKETLSGQSEETQKDLAQVLEIAMRKQNKSEKILKKSNGDRATK